MSLRVDAVLLYAAAGGEHARKRRGVCQTTFPPTAADNVLRILRDEPPMYVKNPEVLNDWRVRLNHLAQDGSSNLTGGTQ